MAENKQEEQAKIDSTQQVKLQEKVANQNRDDELKEMPAAELRQQLTKKNADYVFRLQKELASQGHLSQNEAATRVDALLPDLVVAQRHGQPAASFYNMPPKIKAANLLKPKQKTAADIPFWQYAVDSALLYVAMFVGIFGVIGLFQPNTKANAQMGILTLVSVGAGMGIFMTKYNDLVMPAASGNHKVPWTKLILGMVAMLAILFALIYLLSIPALQVINPVLPGIVNLLIAAAAYGIRWLFRRHYQIIGSVFTPASKNK